MKSLLAIMAIFLCKIVLLSSCGGSPPALAANKLLQSKDLVYQGAFRMPSGTYGGSSFDYGGSAMAYNPINNSLYMVGHPYQQNVAEVAIPVVVNSAVLSDLNTATVIQNFGDITEGQLTHIASGGAPIVGSGVYIGGLMLYGNKLIGTAFAYYDAGNSAVLSHFTSGLTIAATGDFAGMYQVGATPSPVPDAGFVDGYMTLVPDAWRATLGGPALTGQCCINIISRTSWGPSAFVFDPDDLGNRNTVPVSSVLYYSSSHPTLGQWNVTSSVFNGTTSIAGIAFPNNTLSILYIGRQGIGPYCYGAGTSDPSKHLLPVPPSGIQHYCFDPANPNEGNHGYPYQYQVWAYNLNDFLDVKNGMKQPWQITPYAVWSFNLPFGDANQNNLGGVAYDSSAGRIFISQGNADKSLPIVHVFQLNL